MTVKSIQQCLPLLIVGLMMLGCARRMQTSPTDAAALQKLQTHAPTSIIDGRGRVVELELEHKNVDDSTLLVVKDLSELRRLSLFGSSVTDDGLAHLGGLVRLEALGLGETQVTDDGVVSLQQLPNLKWLWITDVDVTYPAIQKLKAARPQLMVYER